MQGCREGGRWWPILLTTMQLVLRSGVDFCCDQRTPGGSSGDLDGGIWVEFQIWFTGGVGIELVYCTARS
ncbi:hypothetical protein KC19_VG160400 [Ceratodon purpureus]|uniref:Secreted protein n=1 Tax=Ceratodon purpureus TaxID=3225 RepID=A0A8T0HQN9_CERPU|nr:hypothetical protein KC19_VG160400 [Ceratodon purpureus]